MSQALEIQVDPMKLLQHGGIQGFTSHLTKQVPTQPEVDNPEKEFALLNVMVNVVDAVRKVDPNRPETVVLQAMAKNYVSPDSMETLASGGTVTPSSPKEMQSPEFKEALRALAVKFKDDPPRRDALTCIAAAAEKRPLTTNEIFQVFRHLGDTMELTPGQRQQVMQQLAKSAQIPISDDVNKKLDAQGAPSAFELATVVNQGVSVKPDGKFAPRASAMQQGQEETVAMLLALSQEFWEAVFKAQQQKKMQDDQRDMAELIRNTGAMYVKQTRHGSAVKMATVVEATAHRFLIKKLRRRDMKAWPAQMAAVERLAQADETGQAPGPEELVQILGALGEGVKMTPEMTQATLDEMARDHPKSSQDSAAVKPHLLATAAEVIRAVNQVTLRKPEEANACLNLYVNMFMAMHATKQMDKITDPKQREIAETLRMAGRIYGQGGKKESGGSQSEKSDGSVDVNAYHVMLMKLRNDPLVKADKSKASAVDALIASQATKTSLTQNQLLEIFKDLSRGIVMTPEMLRVTLEYMCTAMRTLTPNEKVELQKRFRQNPGSPTDVISETEKVRTDTKLLREQTQVVGAFQILPPWHPAASTGRPMSPSQFRPGMLAGPATASVEWHRYRALGNSPPAIEMARVVLVQSMLEEAQAVEDEALQQTLKNEASQMTFRSVLQPTVVSKYQETLKGDKAAMGALQGLSKTGGMDDEQLSKKVNELLETLTIERGNLRAVLNQLVRDRVMTNDEARVLERACETKKGESGGKMKLTDLQVLLREKKGGK